MSIPGGACVCNMIRMQNYYSLCLAACRIRKKQQSYCQKGKQPAECSTDKGFRENYPVLEGAVTRCGKIFGEVAEFRTKRADQDFISRMALTIRSARLSARALFRETTAQMAAGNHPIRVICSTRQSMACRIMPLRRKDNAGRRMAISII